ncbi:hypothetical protein FRB98_003260 [Tulasnella sp. 332]|nr:hypothetical protein FRB98_003260 [Tulasnella sp. 332]
MTMMMMMGQVMKTPAAMRAVQLGGWMGLQTAKQSIPYLYDFPSVLPTDAFDILALYSVLLALILIRPGAVLNILSIIWTLKTTRYFFQLPLKPTEPLVVAPLRVSMFDMTNRDADDEEEVERMLVSELSYRGPHELDGCGQNMVYHVEKRRVLWKARALRLLPEPMVCVPGPLTLQVESVEIDVNRRFMPVITPAYQSSRVATMSSSGAVTVRYSSLSTRTDDKISPLARWSFVPAVDTIIPDGSTHERSTPVVQHDPCLMAYAVAWDESDDFLNESLDFGDAPKDDQDSHDDVSDFASLEDFTTDDEDDDMEEVDYSVYSETVLGQVAETVFVRASGNPVEQRRTDVFSRIAVDSSDSSVCAPDPAPLFTADDGDDEESEDELEAVDYHAYSDIMFDEVRHQSILLNRPLLPHHEYHPSKHVIEVESTYLIIKSAQSVQANRNRLSLRRDALAMSEGPEGNDLYEAITPEVMGAKPDATEWSGDGVGDDHDDVKDVFTGYAFAYRGDKSKLASIPHQPAFLK